jgi:TPR repeat protein
VGAAIFVLIGDSDKPSSKIKESTESVSTPTATPAAKEETTPAETPAALRPYMEKAREGDAKSMHMLAVMYYNGLNVRQNREEGLKWYHKAAEAGSDAARKELKQIEAMSGK